MGDFSLQQTLATTGGIFGGHSWDRRYATSVDA